MRLIRKNERAAEKFCYAMTEELGKATADRREALWECICLLMDEKIPFEDEKNWIVRYLLLTPEKMRQLVDQKPLLLRKNTWFREVYEKKFANGNDKGIGREAYNANQFWKDLNIRICPYCDRNYVDWIEEDKGIHRLGQIDHFFHKSAYPMLAMNFFNLIPSCPSCNIRKQVKVMGINPYEERIREAYQILAAPPVGKIDFTEEDIEIKFLETPDFAENSRVLGLHQLYERSGDIAYEIIKKSIFYNDEKIDELCRNFPVLFPNRDETRRIIWGMPFEEEAQRPMKRLYEDILDEYKVPFRKLFSERYSI